MTDLGTAALQIQRMMGLRGFPRQREGQEELIKALSRAANPELAVTIVDAWIATETEAPRPADIYRLVGEENTRADKRPKCKECGGSGWISRNRLVTYQGNSFRIIKSERIESLTYEQEIDLRHSIYGPSETPPRGFNRQDVLSCAEPCACLPTTHKAFTDGR